MDCCGHEGPGGGDAKFEIHKVADGVHAAVAAPAYKVNCNTAIIENADGVMIVDTHSKPSAARVIIDKLRDITKKPVRYVVNTHSTGITGTATRSIRPPIRARRSSPTRSRAKR